MIYQPPDESLEGVVWFGCLNESATSFGCTVDPDLLDGLSEPPTDPSEQLAWFTELQEAGLLGFEPALPPTWTILEEALDTLEEADKVEGVSAFLNLTVIPTEAENDEDIEVAFKRYPISLNPEPNENPLLSHLWSMEPNTVQMKSLGSSSEEHWSSTSPLKTARFKNTRTSIQIQEYRRFVQKHHTSVGTPKVGDLATP